jgi:uncharacterized membrane protein (DUF4010 family)
VLFFSGLSFLGYVARRLVGPGHGYLATGLIGGLMSSTQVTYTFARTSRRHPAIDRELAFGAVAANAMLFPRVLVATAALNAPLVPLLVPYLLGAAIIAAGVSALGAFRLSDVESEHKTRQNPLQLLEALRMAALFQIVLMAVHLANRFWGDAGVLSTAALLGLTDVDALTMSMARGMPGDTGLELAARAIAIGVVANTALKLAVTLFLGAGSFRTIAGGTLAAMLVASVAWLAL